MTYQLTYTGDPASDRLPGIPLGDLIVVTEAEAKALTSTGFYKRDGTGPKDYEQATDRQAAVTRATTAITRDRAARAAEIRAARAEKQADQADEPTEPPAAPPAEPEQE